jgi:hypothetical protein
MIPVVPEHDCFHRCEVGLLDCAVWLPVPLEQEVEERKQLKNGLHKQQLFRMVLKNVSTVHIVDG